MNVTGILIKSARVFTNNWSRCRLLHYPQTGRWHNLLLSMAGSSEGFILCFYGINPGLPGPIKAPNAVLRAIFMRLYHCARLGCEFLVASKSWNKKWLYWECRMPELALCALEPCVLECTIYSMFPKVKHQPLLSHTSMTTWISTDSSPPTRTGEQNCLQHLFQISVIGPLLQNCRHLNFCQQLKVVSSSLVTGNTWSQWLLQEQSYCLKRHWMCS